MQEIFLFQVRDELYQYCKFHQNIFISGLTEVFQMPHLQISLTARLKGLEVKNRMALYQTSRSQGLASLPVKENELLALIPYTEVDASNI